MAAPLFLLAPPRSYTSLMNAMLGQHPQAFGLPELCLFNVSTLVDNTGRHLFRSLMNADVLEHLANFVFGNSHARGKRSD